MYCFTFFHLETPETIYKSSELKMYTTHTPCYQDITYLETDWHICFF